MIGSQDLESYSLSRILLKLRKNTTARFLLAGTFNTAVGLLLFPILYTILGQVGVHYLAVLILCHLASVCLSFVLNKEFVFKVKGSSLRQFLLHSGFHWLYFGLNLVLLPLIVEGWKFDPRIVQFCISCVAMVLSYAWQKHVVFSNNHNE